MSGGRNWQALSTKYWRWKKLEKSNGWGWGNVRENKASEKCIVFIINDNMLKNNYEKTRYQCRFQDL
ncbi:CCHC-type domain-containing protein [Aphis craccivora]|uniref:CCHC-type domain-containing protein n=1 Tax=Aphis craccivora TaxID=307492 RepID=A0A6G0YRA3_APHCR|nr:CCHC-type domain-containing protein [Aphis craccivora]